MAPSFILPGTEFSQSRRSRFRRIRALLSSTTTRLVIIISVLTLLQPLSPMSGTSNVAPQSSDSLPTSSPRDAPLEENLNTAKSSQGISMLKTLSKGIGKSNKDLASRIVASGCDHQSRSHSTARVEATNEAPSWMAAAQPQRVNALF